MAVQHIPWISPEEFLDQEALASTKHFYYKGLVTSMAGGTFLHGIIAMNLGGELRAALRGRDCAVVGSDLMIRTGSAEMLVYPDITVICGELETMPGRPTVATNPVFLAEVLSPSTEALDRGAKASEYRRTDSIRQFALIAQDEAVVEIHTRDAAGFWRIEEVRGLDAVCNFTQIGCEVPMQSIYERAIEA